MKSYWETLQLIDRFQFTSGELKQLLALDLCKIDTADVEEYLENVRHLFDHTRLDAQAFKFALRDMQRMSEVPYD